MANFCTNCGAQATGAFCMNCGAPLTAAAPPPAAPPPAPMKPASSSGLKILLAVVAVFFLIGALAVGGLVYAGYRAKQKIAELRQEYVRDHPSSERTSRTTRTSSGTCPALATEDAASVLGVSIERIDFKQKSDATEECDFYVSAADRERLANSQTPASPDPNAKDTEKLVTDALAAVQRYAAKDDSGFSFQLNVVRTGAGEKWRGVEKINSAGFGMHRVDGLGDDAYLILGGQSVFVRKGDAMAVLTFRNIVPGADKAKTLAKAAVANL